MKPLSPEQWQVIEEAAQVLEAAAKHNRAQGRTIFAHVQQERADRLLQIVRECKDE